MKIVTCETVRKVFGEFECCSSCHSFCDEGFSSLYDDPYSLCCASQEVLEKNNVHYNEAAVTHPALLKAMEDNP